MNCYLRYGLIVIALVTVLLLGLIIYFAVIFDSNAYKPLVIDLVKEKKQRELRLDGDINLSLFPKLGIELGPLTLSERNSNVEFASAERVLVSLALLPLLRKQLELDEVLIKGLKANLIRLNDGSINLADLLAKSEEHEQFKLSVGHVAAENGVLTFSDEASGRHFALTHVNLEANSLDPGLGPTAGAVRSKVELGFTLNHPGGAEANLATTLAFDLTLDVDKQYYAVQGLSLKSEGQLLGMHQFMLHCTGEFSASLATESVAAESGGPGLMASNVAIKLVGINGQSALDIELHTVGLSLAAERMASDKIAVAAKMTGPEGRVSGTLSLSAMEGNLSDLRGGALLVELEAVKNDWTIHTMLGSPLESSFTTAHLNLPEIKGVMHARGAGLANSGINGTLLGSVAIDVKSRNAQADFTGQFADTNITAKLIASAFAEPSLNFDVEIDQLDLDRLLPPEQQSGDNLKKKENLYASEQWLDLSALEGLNVQGSIRIGMLKAGNSRSSRLSLTVQSH
jgi:AsmA protein